MKRLMTIILVAVALSSTTTINAGSNKTGFSASKEVASAKSKGDAHANYVCYNVVTLNISASGWIQVAYGGGNWQQGYSRPTYVWYDFGAGVSRQITYYIPYGYYVDSVWIQQGNVISASGSCY